MLRVNIDSRDVARAVTLNAILQACKGKWLDKNEMMAALPQYKWGALYTNASYLVQNGYMQSVTNEGLARIIPRVKYNTLIDFFDVNLIKTLPKLKREPREKLQIKRHKSTGGKVYMLEDYAVRYKEQLQDDRKARLNAGLAVATRGSSMDMWSNHV